MVWDSSVEIRKRITDAFEIQNHRFKDFPNVHYKARMDRKQIRKFCDFDKASQEIWKIGIERLYLPSRAYDRI